MQKAFEYVGFDWQDYVVLDETFYRPSEVCLLKGDFSKAEKKLGWQPKVQLDELVAMMVEGDLKELDNGNDS